MIWVEVEKKYGKKLADKMKKSPYLKGITITMAPNGEADIPESDIRNAWKWAVGRKVEAWEID